ncbi:MAG: endolytic transglycosylase MltG [Deltaproteobacteria bacterium]|nr:endolytic transglycosylase MltG [Deltaproteobacteria bacterium]
MKYFIAAAALLICLAAGCLLGTYISLDKPVNHDEATFVVQHGTPLIMIAEQLARAGIIRSPALFAVYARLARVDRSIKAGEYQFQSGLSSFDVLNKLKNGDCKLYKITLIEGWTAAQIADYLANQSFAAPSFGPHFLSVINDEYFAKSAGVDEKSLEGYLFPNTYFIERPRTAEWLVSRLVYEFKKAYTGELEARAKEIGFSQREVITLASIIEKETGLDSERAIISSVFHNRLKKKMPLQADPTVIYGLKGFDGNLRKADLSNPHLYNTYVHQGLPPGPISNPGLASIRAALWPATTDFLYFVARGNGSHEFTKTLSEHSKAVAKYQIKAH